MLFVLLLLIPTPPQFDVQADDDRERVESAVSELIATDYPSDDWRAKPALRRIVGAGTLPPGPLKARFAAPDTKFPKGLTMVVLSGQDSGVDEKEASALVYISVFDSVLTTVDVVTRGQIVDAQVLRWVVRNVTQSGSRFLTSNEWRRLRRTNAELIATRHLQSGRLLAASDIAIRPDVTPGDAVKVIIARSGISVSVDCVAREEAIVGEELRVYSKETKRTYRVRLQNGNDALWMETL